MTSQQWGTAMKSLTVAAAFGAAFALSGCVEETSAPSAAMPNAAEQACLRDVTRETNNPEVVLLGSEFSEAGTMVRVGVGPNRAPWQCVAYRDGTTDGIMSLTNEGTL